MVMNRIDTAYSFHLVRRFECFGYTLLLRHSGNDDFHAFVAGLVNFSQVFGQFPPQKKVYLVSSTLFKRLGKRVFIFYFKGNVGAVIQV